MEKKTLLLFPLIIGVILMAYSWCLSYPLSYDSSSDFVFNHVSILYWLGLALTLPSLYMIAATSKRNLLKWVVTLGVFMAIFSLSYFYYLPPGSDSFHTTGLTEFFIRTKNLDTSQPSRGYFQWPSFFILAAITSSVSGLELTTIEFLSYAIIGFLMATALYVYASKANKNSGFLAVIAFFIVMFNFLNYQFVPFSLAFGLLLLLFKLESRRWTSGLLVTMLVLFVGITLTHAFVPLFFILYLLIQWVLSKSSQHGKLCLVTSIIYFIMQFSLASNGFANSIVMMITSPTEYSSVIKVQSPALVPIDSIAQMLSRTVTIAFGILCLAGFILLLARRKLRNVDKAIFLTGVVYSGTGVVLYTLGSRAIPIIFISVSLGASYLFETKLRPYLIGLLLILLTLVAFVPVYASFIDSPTIFQTQEALTTDNFMIDKKDWNAHSTVLSHVSDKWYIFPQIEGNSILDTDFSSSFQNLSIEAYDSIIYSIGLAKSIKENGFSEQNMSQRILDRFNVIYNSGLSYIAEKPR